MGRGTRARWGSDARQLASPDPGVPLSRGTSKESYNKPDPGVPLSRGTSKESYNEPDPGVPLSRGTSEESYDELGGYTTRLKFEPATLLPLHRDCIALLSPLKEGRHGSA